MTPPDRSARLGTPVNHKLPPYDGSTDPLLWLRQVNAAFEAYNTPAHQHLRWLVLAICGQAIRYWFFEVEPQGQVTSTAPFLQLLVQRFRPYSQSYHLQQQLNALRMQPGGYLSYSDRFLEIARQQRHLSPEALLNVFYSGLTVEDRTACLTHQVSDIWKAQELCRALHFASANTTSSTLVSSLRTLPRHFITPSRSSSFQRRLSRLSFSRSPHPWRPRTPTRTPSTHRSTSGSSRQYHRSTRPTRPTSCFQCGQPGHRKRDCAR